MKEKDAFSLVIFLIVFLAFALFVDACKPSLEVKTWPEEISHGEIMAGMQQEYAQVEKIGNRIYLRNKSSRGNSWTLKADNCQAAVVFGENSVWIEYVTTNYYLPDCLNLVKSWHPDTMMAWFYDNNLWITHWRLPISHRIRVEALP